MILSTNFGQHLPRTPWQNGRKNNLKDSGWIKTLTFKSCFGKKSPERSKETMSYHLECYLISYCFERINLMLFLPAWWSLIDFQRSLFDLFPSQGNIAFRALWRASNNVVIPTKMATTIGKHGINIIYGRFLVADHLICRYLIETIFHVNVAHLPLIWSPASYHVSIPSLRINWDLHIIHIISVSSYWICMLGAY